MPQGIIAKINEIENVGRIKIGQIDILRNSARLEADSRYTSQILEAFQQTEINGKTVTIGVTQAAPVSTNKWTKRKPAKPRRPRRPHKS